MRMAIVLGSLVILVACSNPVAQDSNAMIAAKNAEIETLERQIQILQARKTASGQGVTLEEILQKIETDSKELSFEDQRRVTSWEAEVRAMPNICREFQETAPALTPPTPE